MSVLRYPMLRRTGVWGCHRTGPLAHPWLPIPDVACGFDERLTDRRCTGCHRARAESRQDQLDALRELGEAAQAQREAPENRPPISQPAPYHGHNAHTE